MNTTTKYLLITAIPLMFFNCKNEESIKDSDTLTEHDKIEVINTKKDSLRKENLDLPESTESIGIEVKQKNLINKQDERIELKNLILDKKYIVNSEDYSINLNYPLLNETFKPTHINFNEFIKNYYLNISNIESEILETKMICKDLESIDFNEKRFIDYKIYEVNDQLISVLFYKENFYSGSLHPTYSFDCFNFHLNRGAFMNYEDFFLTGSEKEMTAMINQKILSNIKQGEIYYDCWELNSSDFLNYKNNFVLNDTYLEYYFDDCVICPSYTGTYSIEIPLIELLPILRKIEVNPLIM